MARLRTTENELTSSCQLCDLSKSCKNICIPGKGSDDPRIVMLGQAPGREEDLAGECFVGPAGEFLHNTISAFGLDAYKIRFENSVRCYPPEDKKPTIKQIKCCKPYLLDSLRRMRPEVVVTLGSVALYALTGIDKIGEFASNYFDFELEDISFVVFPAIHPSVVLRQDRMLGEYTAIFHSLSSFLSRRKTRYHPSYRVIVDAFPAGLALEEISDDRETAIDIETNNIFDPRVPEAKIRCIGFSVEKGSSFSIVVNKDTLPEILKFLKRANKLVAHNAKFETKWIKKLWGIDIRISDDTQILAHLINEEYSTGLEICTSIFTDTINHKGNFNKMMYDKDVNYATVNIGDLAIYNAADCDVTLQCLKGEREEIENDKKLMRLYNEIELPTMETLSRMELRGIKIDFDKAEKLVARAAVRLEEIRDKITSVKEVRSGMKKDGIDQLNLGSSVQVSNLLYKWLGLRRVPGIELTKGGSPSTDDRSIDILSRQFPLVKLIREYRGISHEISEVEVIREKAIDGFISSDYSQSYVVTGRLSSRNPNLQNLPNPKEIELDGIEEKSKFGNITKQIVISRFGDEGVILSADQSQLELRLVGNETGDRKYVEGLNSGEDFHGLTAEYMFGPKWTREQRYIAKRINFACVYGVGPGELSKNLLKSKTECKEYLQRYQETYPDVFVYMNDLHEQCRANGFVRSKFGRVRRISGIDSSDWWTSKRAKNQCGNFPIASCGADLTKWCMVQVDRELLFRHMESLLICQVHDSLVLDVYKRELRTVINMVREVMVEKAMKVWPFFHKVPLKIDISYGPNWLEQEDYK